MKADPKNVRVCLVAIPEVMASTLMGLYDVFNSFNFLGTYGDGLTGRAHFKAEIVATSAGALSSASGVPVEAGRSIKQIDSADVIIVPSILVERGEWRAGEISGDRRMADRDACCGSATVFHLLGRVAARGNRPARRQGCDGALDVRTDVSPQFPQRAAAAGPGAGRRRKTSGVSHVRAPPLRGTILFFI